MFTKSSGFEHGAVKRVGEQLGFGEAKLVELGERYGFDVTVSKDGSLFDRSLDAYDAFFFYTTGDLLETGNDGSPPMSARGKRRLLSAVRDGKGFVGAHCASDTFHSPGERALEQKTVDPFIEMIGGEFVTHGSQQVGRMRVVDVSFPGIRQLGEGFDLHEEWYSLKNFHPDMHVVLMQETEGMEGAAYQRAPYPATWLRPYGRGRVFYTSMGHRRDVWESEPFRRVVVAGLLWTLRDVEADTSPNLERVAPGARLDRYPT